MVSFHPGDAQHTGREIAVSNFEGVQNEMNRDKINLRFLFTPGLCSTQGREIAISNFEGAEEGYQDKVNLK